MTIKTIEAELLDLEERYWRRRLAEGLRLMPLAFR